MKTNETKSLEYILSHHKFCKTDAFEKDKSHHHEVFRTGQKCPTKKSEWARLPLELAVAIWTRSSQWHARTRSCFIKKSYHSHFFRVAQRQELASLHRTTKQNFRINLDLEWKPVATSFVRSRAIKKIAFQQRPRLKRSEYKLKQLAFNRSRRWGQVRRAV